MSIHVHFSDACSTRARPRDQWRGIIVLFLVVLCRFNSIAGPSVEGKGLRITFSPETGGIVSILNPLSGHDFISHEVRSPRLWRLVIAKTNEKPVELLSENCPAPVIHLEKHSADLLWKSLLVNGIRGSFDVHVKCRILSSDHLAHLHIDVENHSDASLLSTAFPEFSALGTSGKSDVAFPKFNWGEMFKGLKTRLYGSYPSADMPMQFFVLSDASDSLYCATQDQSALNKNFLIEPGALCSVETTVPDATVAGNMWHSPFDFVLGVYEGDWVAGCKLYREWVTREAPWTARGPISRRKDLAPATRNVGVWLNLSGNFAENADKALAFREQIGVPIGVHWYDWHHNPFDRDYPAYLPAKPGFNDAVRKLNNSQVYSMPYINGRLWDTRNTNFTRARNHAVMSASGEPHLEDYKSGTKLAVMCLGDPFWQTNLTHLIREVVDATGVDGIYIDQVAGSPIAECYDKTHGHTLGRDRWWIDGYRKSITGARKELTKQPRGFFVAAENNAEPYMDFVDLFLIWIPRSENDIPMMTAVYSGYTQYFGTNRDSNSDMSFAMLQARDFTWGAQLFWESAYILGPEQKEKMKILTNLARLRYRTRKYMVEGEWLAMVKPTSPVPTVAGKCGSWTSGLESRTLPAVHASLWKSNDGSYAVVIANANIQEEKFEFDFAPARLAGKKWNVQKVTPEATETLAPLKKAAIHQALTVPSRSGVVLLFSHSGVSLD